MEPVLWARQTRERDTYRRYYLSQANLKGACLGQARLPGVDLSKGEENTEEGSKIVSGVCVLSGKGCT
jgi:hypothetical protein